MKDPDGRFENRNSALPSLVSYVPNQRCIDRGEKGRKGHQSRIDRRGRPICRYAENNPREGRAPGDEFRGSFAAERSSDTPAFRRVCVPRGTGGGGEGGENGEHIRTYAYMYVYIARRRDTCIDIAGSI
jgi:hypothetical protein